MSVEIDLLGDYEQLLRADFAREGHPVGPKDTLNDLLRKAVNFTARRVQPQKWVVLRSRQLAERTLPQEINKAVNTVQGEAETGIDLNPRLSRTTKRINYNDLLFNDWGFYHFHLGNGVDADGYVGRTDDLLFVVTRSTSMYFIDVLPHQGSFSSIDLLEIVHENWPQILARYKMAGISGLSHNPTDAEVAAARKVGLQVFVQLKDGTVYAPPGGGISTAGTNISHTMQADFFVRQLSAIEAEVQTPEKEGELRLAISGTGATCPPTLRLKLVEVQPTTLVVSEENTGIQFRLNLSG